MSSEQIGHIIGAMIAYAPVYSLGLAIPVSIGYPRGQRGQAYAKWVAGLFILGIVFMLRRYYFFDWTLPGSPGFRWLLP